MLGQYLAMLRERVDLQPLHEALAVAFTYCLPPQYYTLVIEAKAISAENVFTNNSLTAFLKVCRTYVIYLERYRLLGGSSSSKPIV